MKINRRSFIAVKSRALVVLLSAFLCFGILLSGVGVKAKHSERSRKSEKSPAALVNAQMGASSVKMDAEHAELARLAGEYNRAVKFLGQTGAAAAPSSGTCKISVVLGGRFLMEESHDTVFGKPVDGLRIYGYNDATKQYEMARMYTMSNAITMMKGASSDGGKTIDYTGEAGTAGMGRMALRAKLHVVNDNEFTVTMSTAGANGKDMPFQETIYTRKR
jgi:Protein of unknown function (DUF1579)